MLLHEILSVTFGGVSFIISLAIGYGVYKTRFEHFAIQLSEQKLQIKELIQQLAALTIEVTRLTALVGLMEDHRRK